MSRGSVDASAHRINASECGRYIRVKLVGDITRESAMRVILEAHTLGLQLDIHRYLVDAALARNVESVTDGYTFAYRDMHSAEGIDRLARVTLWVAPDDHSHDFIEVVSKNAGFDLTLFRDEESAMEHLLADL